MTKTPKQTLQEKIIKKLETKKLDSSDFEYAKVEIQNILDKEKLIELDQKIEEINFEEIDHFLSYFNGLLNDILGKEKDSLKQDGIKEHGEAICANAKEVMSHKIVVKAIKDFYKRKLNGEYNQIRNLSEEEIQKEKIKYQETTGWNKYSREIFFVKENKEDFFIYLFENNIFDKAKEKYLYEERKYVFNILSSISGINEIINIKEILNKNEKYCETDMSILREFNDDFFKFINFQEFFKVINLQNFFRKNNWKKFFKEVDLRKFFKEVSIEEFFKVVVMNNFFKVVAVKEFFKVVDFQDFFKEIKWNDFFKENNLKEFFSNKKISLKIDNDNDLRIYIKDKIFEHYKKCYIGEKGFYVISYNNSYKYFISFNKEKKKIKNIPSDIILLYDRDNGGFKF